MDTTEQRQGAPLPAKASLKLPLLAPYDSPEAIVQALTSRENLVLIAGLIQLEKGALGLVAKAAPRAVADPLLDYLTKYPTVDGVFAAWDTAHKTNNSQLAAAVLSALSALIRLVSTDAFASEPEIIRRLLSQYGSHLDRALNPGRNDVTVAALKLCNVVVGFGSGRFARRLFSSMQWSPKIITRLFRTRLKDASRDPLLKPDIRTLLTMLVLAFLSAGDSRLKTELLDSKGLVSGMIKGLSEDPEVVVNHVLIGLYRDVIVDRSVGLESRRSVFDESCILELVKLYDVVPEDGADPFQALRISIHRFFYALAEWLATQINDSQTRSFGPQKVLGTVLRNLKVTEDPEQRELGLHILEKAPILAGAFWARFPSSLDPRLSSRWISTVTFATLAVSLPVSPHLLVPISASLLLAPPSLTSVLDNIFPPSLTKIWYSKALQHESPLVSFLSSIFMLASLQKATRVLEALATSSSRLEEDAKSGRWAGLALRVREHCRVILPDPQIVVALMQKTAVIPVVASSKSSKKSSKPKAVAVVVQKKVEEDVEMKDGEKDEGAASSRHLRTNVALRILWLYHRVTPSLISTLRFDFARLPQAHIAETDAEGIRAISSAYALRLAAIHSATISWSRPGDYFKNTLLPLFQLYRTPSTPSNLNLLLSVLSRLLQTPLLFGSTLWEVQIWLAALPTPSVDESDPTLSADQGDMAVLDFFEKSVQKALTAPIKNSTSATEDIAPGSTSSSPLLTTILAGLPAEITKAGKDLDALLGFVRLVLLGFIGHSASKDAPEQLVAELSKVLDGKNKSVKEALSFLKDCIAALGGDGKVALVAREVEVLSARSPIKDNVFVIAGGELALLEQLLSGMPLDLVFLHVRPEDLAAPEITTLLNQLASNKSAWSVAVQVLLHRYIGVSWSDSDRQLLGAFIQSVIVGCNNEKVNRELKVLLVGEEGLLKSFMEEEKEVDLLAGIATIVVGVLDSTSSFDRSLAGPYCALVISDLAYVETPKSKKKDASKTLPPRLLASAPLVPFFDNSSTMAILDILLSKITVASVPSLDGLTRSLLDATLIGAGQLSGSEGFRKIWTSHFNKLHQLWTAGALDSAGAVLALGAQSLLPFVVPGVSTVTNDAPTFEGFRSGSADISWRENASAWTTILLSQSTLGVHHSQVLATLIYRSPETRAEFTKWLLGKVSEEESTLVGAEAAIRALLEVNAVLDIETGIPESIAIHLVERIFATSESSLASDADLRRIIQLLCLSSPSISSSINQLLNTRIAAIDRDTFTSRVLHLLSDLAPVSKDFGGSLTTFVNSTFAGLVRRFAEDDEDTPPVTDFVRDLHAVVGKHSSLVYKSHLLDPLVTAAVTRRLDKLEPILLAAALCRNHTWKSNEVTRLLNSVFASPHFVARAATDALDLRKVQFAVLSLIGSLSDSSIAAASSCRIVERLVPFYGGTLSSDDVALLDLFQRVELLGGVSISAAFRAWNPSLEGTPIEGSRAGSLASLQPSYVHRTCLRVCASSKTPFPKEHAEITYDPAFLLPFLSHSISEDDFKAQDWINLLESGVLGLPIAALAASSDMVRLAARTALANTLTKLAPLSFREKDEITLIVNHARNCIFSQVGEPIPSVIALFLANCMAIAGTPESPLYPPLSRFLLQRSLLDQRDVPMFYLLFYATSEEPVEDQRWLFKFLAEGLVRNQDWKIYRRRQTFELLASFLQASRQDPITRKLILQFILRATSIPQAARELLSRNGLLGWIVSQVPIDVSERRILISIVSNMVQVLSVDKLSGPIDALDALIALVSPIDLSSSELSTLSTILCTLASRLSPLPYSSPSPDATSSHRLFLARARSLLTTLLTTSALRNADAAVQIEFYRAVMAVCFARQSFGIEEGNEERRLFSGAIGVALRAGMGDVNREALRYLAGHN